MSSYSSRNPDVEQESLLSSAFDLSDTEACQRVNYLPSANDPANDQPARWYTLHIYSLLTRKRYSERIWQRLARKWAHSMHQPKSVAILASVLTAFLLFMILYALTPSIRSQSHIHGQAGLNTTTADLVKPEGFKIIAIVFYGRQKTVEILDCYLRQNLVVNGGFLDEVQFMIHTDNGDDLAYLSRLVAGVEEYKDVTLTEGINWPDLWRAAVEYDPRAMYIKIDDDLVWIDRSAIPEMVHTLLTEPLALSVQVNLINAAALGWLHYHLGAVRSYLPEIALPSNISNASYGPTAWRASALPTWQPTDGNGEDLGQFESKDSRPFDAYPQNHRWLPLRTNKTRVSKTPIAATDYDPFSTDLAHWAMGAQKHYSLLHDLDEDPDDSLEKYKLGGDGIWYMRYGRANINLMAIWGKDILNSFPWDTNDDEHVISVILPQKLNRLTLVQTRALAAHFAFSSQGGMYNTDLLSRYRAYANKMVCATGHQIPIHST